MNGLQIKSESSKKRAAAKRYQPEQSESFPLIQKFLAFMEAKGYEIKNAEFGENSRKYITFRSPDMSHPVRGSAKSLGKKILLRNVSKNALIISSTELLFLLFVIS